MGKSNKKSAMMTLKEGKKEPEDNLETKANLKKQKKDETETIKDNQAIVGLLVTKTNHLHATLISDKAKDVYAKNESSSSDEEPAKPAATKDDSKDVQAEITSSYVSLNNRLEVRTKRGKRAAYTPQSGIGGNDDQTIIVKGFDSSLPEDDIKSALSRYFSSCGEIISVIVPTDPVTGAVMGCAYTELKEGIENALKLSGSNLGGWNLFVEKATPISDVGGPSGTGGHWPYPYRCNGLRHCRRC